jgi:hypothetical protein
MIQFCNACLDEAKATGQESIRNEDVVAARRPYSEYLVQELDDEIHATHPKWQRYLDVLRRIHLMRFSREDFDKAFATLKVAKLGQSEEEVLEMLYSFGIVGFTKVGGSGYGGSSVAFSFRDERINFDPGASTFTVHPGLKEALELIEAAESR